MSEHESKTSTATPRGITQFIDTTKALAWGAQDAAASLQKLFEAVNQLALTDFEYYQKRAKSQAAISYWLRVAGAGFGTLGVISPALLATGEPIALAIAKWGYSFFALSGSAFAVNSLFGGTSGHARYVAAQLRLEEVIIRYGVKWSQYSAWAKAAAIADEAADTAVDATAGANLNQEPTETGFNLILEFLAQYTAITQQETLQWASDVVEDARNYASSHKAGAAAEK